MAFTFTLIPMCVLICVVRKISHSQWLHGKQTCFYSSVVPSLICLLMETSLPAGRHPLSLAAPHTSTRPDLKGFTIKDSCMYVWYTTPSGFYNNIPSYFHKTRPQGLHNNGLSQHTTPPGFYNVIPSYFHRGFTIMVFSINLPHLTAS